MIARGKRPHLAIDFHNDASGKLHFARSETNDAQSEGYLPNLQDAFLILDHEMEFPVVVAQPHPVAFVREIEELFSRPLLCLTEAVGLGVGSKVHVGEVDPGKTKH